MNYLINFMSFAYNQKMDIEDDKFLKKLQAKLIRKQLKNYRKDLDVGICDSIFDRLVNSIK